MKTSFRSLFSNQFLHRATEPFVIAAGRSPIVLVLGLGLLFSLTVAGSRILALRWDEHPFLFATMALGTIAGWELVCRTAKRRTPLPILPFLLVTVTAGLIIRAVYVTYIQPEWYSDFRSYWIYGERLASGTISASDGGYARRANFLTRPLIEVFGANPIVVPYSNILVLTLIQVLGYDVLRRVRSHQIAQSFTLIWLAAPIPLMTAAVPNHDLAGLMLTVCALWLCVVPLLQRSETVATKTTIFCWVTAGLLLSILEAVRGLGNAYLICLTLITGAGAAIAFSQGRARNLAVRSVTGLVVVVVAFGFGQATLRATGNTTKPAAEQHGRLLYTTPHINSISDGTYGFRYAFENAFMESYSDDTEGLGGLRRSIGLTDFIVDPVGRAQSVIARMKRQYSLGSEENFYLRGIDPHVRHALTGYNVLFGTSFAALLLFSIIRLAQSRTQPSIVDSFLLLLTAIISAALLLIGESQPRYISVIWLCGAVVIPGYFSLTHNQKEPARGPTWIVLSATAFPLAIAIIAWLGASLFFVESRGRILHDWEFVANIPSVEEASNFFQEEQHRASTVLIARNGKPISRAFDELSLKLAIPPGGTQAAAITSVCGVRLPAALEFHYDGPAGSKHPSADVTLTLYLNGATAWSASAIHGETPTRVQQVIPVDESGCTYIRFQLDANRDAKNNESRPQASTVEVFFPRVVRSTTSSGRSPKFK